jgi:hypothetical protein
MAKNVRKSAIEDKLQIHVQAGLEGIAASERGDHLSRLRYNQVPTARTGAVRAIEMTMGQSILVCT